MSPNRREFMHTLGTVLASVLFGRCRLMRSTLTPRTPPRRDEGPWDRVRGAWYDLELLALDAHDYDKGEQTRVRLLADHRAALDALVDRGEIDPDVADDLHLAFEGACHHVWRANAPITCYVPSIGPEYRIESSSDLARQADLLAEMADRSDIDEATVERARAAIERDIAFLALAPEDQRALIDAVMEAAEGRMDYPRLSELDLEVPPSSLEAARILVEVLLGER